MQTFPEAYLDYLLYYHGERDYFECHEVLEAYWKNHRSDPLSSAYVGLIQVAVAMYHHRRGNLRGAAKMLTSALRLLTPDKLEALGIMAAPFRDKLEQRLALLEHGEAAPFADLDIPLSDEALAAACRGRCKEFGYLWGAPSNMEDSYLLHKHTLRDRSEVIEARSEQLKLRQKRG